MKLGPRRTDSFSMKSRWVWARLAYHTVSVFVPNHPRREDLQRILLNLQRGTSGASVVIDLTALTEPELLAWRETVLLATEVALPIVRELDREALERSDNGDDSDTRIYRGLPTVVVRQGTLREYDQGLLGRPASVLPGDVFNLTAGAPVPVRGSVLDKDVEADSGGEDAPA